MSTYSGDFCARFRELLPLHALGVPLGEDAPALREHLEGCAACRRELDEHRAALSELPLSLRPLRPPPEIKARLLEQIETGQADVAPLPVPLPARSRPASSQTPRPELGPPPPARRGPLLPLALAASLCAAAGLGALLAREHRLRQGSEQELALAKARLGEQGQMTASLEGRLQEAERQLRFVHARSVQLVSLTPPSEAQEGASGRILWDQERRAWLFLAFRLPPPPPDRDYQLWFLVKDGKAEQKGEGKEGPAPRPVSAGVARILPTGELEISLTLPPDLGGGEAVKAAALTLEQKGGAERPTSDPVLYGQI